MGRKANFRPPTPLFGTLNLWGSSALSDPWEGCESSKPYQGPRWGWRALATPRPQLWLESYGQRASGNKQAYGALKETT